MDDVNYAYDLGVLKAKIAVINDVLEGNDSNKMKILLIKRALR